MYRTSPRTYVSGRSTPFGLVLRLGVRSSGPFRKAAGTANRRRMCPSPESYGGQRRIRRGRMAPEMNGWVSIDTAAEASRIDVRTLRQWAATGAIDIEHR